MHNQLTKEVNDRVINSTAAGTTAINGSSVDMTGFEGVKFTVSMGVLTASQVTSLKAQGSNDNSTFVDIGSSSTGNAADADGTKLLILDMYRPGYRYIRPVVVRGTANAVVDGCVATRYHAQNCPTTQGASVSKSVVNYLGAAGTP